VGDGPSDKYKRIRQLGLLTAIPMILAAAPLIGYFLGSWIDRRFGTEPVFTFIFLALGLVAGARETLLILRKSQDSKNGQNG
jgi:ATP synthase protein I